MSKKKSDKVSATEAAGGDSAKDKSDPTQSETKQGQSTSIHRRPTRPTPPVGSTEIEDSWPEVDEGPRPGPVDEIQEAIFEAAQAGLTTEVEFEELADPLTEVDEEPRPGPADEIQEDDFEAAQADLPTEDEFEALTEPLPEVDEGPRPGPVDEVQEAIFDAAREGLATEVDLDALPEPSPKITQKVVKFKPKTPPPEPDVSPQPDPSLERPEPDPVPEPPEPDPSPTISDVWFLLALFGTFRLFTLFLLRPGGFIRDWSDFDTYFGIAALSDYGLFPFLDFWLEWPPLVPWLTVGAYQLALLLPPWLDDARLWFILILGSVFVLFELGNFILVYRLARRLFQSAATINRVLWLYAGLFAPVYTMLGFFDGLALFFILLALYLLLDDHRFPSAIAVGVGFMTKIVPGLMLPVAGRRLWYQHRENNREGGIEIGLYVVAFGLTVFVVLVPFLIGGSQWVLAAARSMLSRSSWETIWAVMEGYYGFGLVLGDRLNPAETGFAAHDGWPSSVWWLITLAFAGLYAFIFTRPANYDRPRNVIAFTGLTVAIFMLYSKGYSPQFLIYLLPFILLLMPDGRGLTYALILTGLNVLEQPVYFVLLPGESWLLIFIVIARFILTLAVAVEFALILWPLAGQSTPIRQARHYAPPVFGGLAVLSLVVLTPLMFRAYSSNSLVDSPVGAFAGFMKTQIQSSQTTPTKPRLLLSEQAMYRRLYPHLHQRFDLQLSDGPAKNFTGAATMADLLQGVDQVWILPTGAEQARLADAVAARGAELAAYNFEGLGTASLYSLRPNPLPTIPLARFNGGIELLGYQTGFKPDRVDVTLYWRARNSQNQNLTVFTQILNKAGDLVAGHDSVPGNGTAPVTGWAVDTVQVDPHRIELPPELPPGQYTVITGLYNDFNERIHGIDPDGDSYTKRAIPLEIVVVR
jgi:hypothetical protein